MRYLFLLIMKGYNVTFQQHGLGVRVGLEKMGTGLAKEFYATDYKQAKRQLKYWNDIND